MCQKLKHAKKKQVGTIRTVVVEKPLQLVSVDLIGELPTGKFGAKYIFSMVDIFRKYVKLFPIRKANTVTLLRKIKEYNEMIGKIKCILNDNGTQFTSNKWYDGLKEMDITGIHTSAYNPQSNQVERYNKEILLGFVGSVATIDTLSGQNI